jgi:MinD-like ATPase involved in chromosome partitioning or flagellar assembly
MSIPIALGAPGLPFESQVLAGAAACGIEVRRRCVDAADLLGACLGAPGLVAVITPGLPRLSAETVNRLRAAGSQVMGIAVRPDDHGVLALLGVGEVLDGNVAAQELLASIASHLHVNVAMPGVWNVEQARADSTREHRAGRLIAVWGPAGAPGRSTTAMLLAHSLSATDRTVIIDVDTAAPSVALKLGLAEDLSGLIIACRHAEAGSLTSRTLGTSVSAISERYFALTGLAHPRRWPELRPAALIRVIDQARADFAYCVVDVGAAFGMTDALAPSPSVAADTALAAADVVVAVCRADPLGIARFLNALPDLIEFSAPIVCVMTDGEQRDQARQLIHEMAQRLGVTIPVADLEIDGRSLDNALRRGTPLRARRGFPGRARPTTRLLELVA